MRLLDLETPNLLSYLAYLVTVWISFLLLLYFFKTQDFRFLFGKKKEEKN